MRYRLSLPEPHSHLFHVEAILERPGATPELALPVWTPGSYLVREFARHLEGVEADDGQGRRLTIERLDKQRFRVDAGGAERVVVRYRVYANELTVRTCHLDGTHGYLNGAAVFLYAPGREREPQVLEIAPPEGWSIATALPGGPTTFTARDYDELADSPVEIGRHRVVPFTALGKPHEIAIWGRGNVEEAKLAEDTRRIVETLGGLMGGLPYERYLFILHLTEKRRGGLEHASSTTLNVGRMQFFPRDAYEETLGLFAHEFFHLWNVKRMRPAALVPFDYGREQYTRLLWWFEGATSYYEGLALARAGLLDAGRYLRNLGRALTQLERTPGARKMSVQEASFLAWVKHYRPDENSGNSAISYYLKGELVALALDLALRRAGSSLDALLRALYARHEGRGLPEDGVEQAAAELLGADAARRFFDRQVRGTEPLDLDLELVGLRLRRRAAQGLDDKGGTPPKNGDERPAPGWAGFELAQGPKLAVASVQEGSPAHRAGLYAEDELVAEGGFRLDRAALWDRLGERGPGGSLRLTVFRRDELVEVTVPLAPWPEDTVWLEPVEAASEAQRAAFEEWSGTRWPGK
ncbi:MULTISPECIES: M61 family metallopeptidase [Anaeromyxobacter]|uniref:M61 family metallopeptidase n=1 Tax=Anaeromyxobacter TaxID=161492 RepID=UPI001F55D7F5|nr:MULTISPECIES: PDZ domain-containing protein [unclassified Anaeromyxobacter]